MKKKLGKVFLILASSAATCLLMEIVVRVLDVPPSPLAPLPIPSYRLSADPVIGYEYRPGYKSTDQPFDASHQGFDINSAGFRDHEHDEKKPAGVYRIIVLGDSTTAGNTVDLDKTYPRQLEQLLNSGNHAGRRYEVFNMGVGGYHTMQEIETLRTKGLKYSPDFVLVTVCLNDFSLQADGGVYERLRKANHLSVPETQTTTLFHRLLRLSRLAFVVYHRLNLSRTSYDQWYLTHVLNGQSPVRAGFVLLSELQQKHGFPAYAVILPGFGTPFDAYRYGAIHQEIFRAAQGLPGISVIDLLPSFARRDNDATRFSYDGLHLNEYGHRVMAEILLPIITASASPQHDTQTQQTGPIIQ